jgi:hypothetical protein
MMEFYAAVPIVAGLIGAVLLLLVRPSPRLSPVRRPVERSK